jgi:hypothetical protein
VDDLVTVIPNDGATSFEGRRSSPNASVLFFSPVSLRISSSLRKKRQETHLVTGMLRILTRD